MTVSFVPVTGPLEGAQPWLGAVDEAVLARWRRAGAGQLRTLVVATRGGRPAAVAFEVHRPLTAYRKIVDLVPLPDAGPDADQLEDELLSAIEQRAWAEGAVAVKREFTVQDSQWARSLTRRYVPVAVPQWAGPVTAEPVLGQICWREGPPARSVPYMRQTTDFTCGPVALQMALCGLGMQKQPNREDEIGLWRVANTITGCDPLGLALAAHRRGAQPSLTLSTTEATLLELCDTDSERDTRRFIQAGFRAELARRGVQVDTAVFELDEVRRALGTGAFVLVLIDQLGMHAESCPHWIVVHSLSGDVFYANDPWTDAELGESFLDGRDLPLPAATLDRLAWYGRPAYRALLVVR